MEPGGLPAKTLGDSSRSDGLRRTYGAAVWNDARNAADCPKIDAWRAALQAGSTTATKPSPLTDCSAAFGNSDIYGGAYKDPTP